MQHNQFATDLAARLEAATEPSRELSDAVLMLVGYTYSQGFEVVNWKAVSAGVSWTAPDGRRFEADSQPDPTADLNAIVAMVHATFPDDGVAWTLLYDFGGLHRARLWIDQSPDYHDVPGRGVECDAATPALALSAALCRALEQSR